MKTHHLAIAKRILLFSAIYFFCILNTSAQLKHFLPDSNAYFSVATLKYWFEGDTTINKLRYKKVYIQMDAEIPNFENAEYFAAVREDTIAEKIYSLQKNMPEEQLIADFGVEVGDTVIVYHSDPYGGRIGRERAVVCSIDSIKLNNSYHKKVIVGPSCGSESPKEYWIEGIGSILGLFSPIGLIGTTDIEISDFLLCVHSCKS